MSSGTASVARAIARVTTAADVARLREHRDVARYAWEIEYDDEVLVTVHLNATRPDESTPADTPDRYVVELDCSQYNVLPPEVRFVDAVTRRYRVGQDLSALPHSAGLPGFQIHSAYSNFTDRPRVDQLVCFSFSRGYYESGHSPQPHERWQPGRHWLYTTLRVLHRALQPPYYQGRMG